MKRLSQAAKDVIASHAMLLNLFERIQCFLQRLSIYSGIPLTAGMTELLGKIMGQVLSILALSTQEIMQRRIGECYWLDLTLITNSATERFLSRLAGKTEIQDALERLDMLTKEETVMTAARNLAVTQGVDDQVKVVKKVVQGIDDKVQVVEGVMRGIGDDVKVVEGAIHAIDDTVGAIKVGP
jgi:hypothetical protein